MSSLRQIFNYLVARPPLVLLTLLAVVLSVYAPALNGQFVWDDGYLVGENPFFRSPVLSLEVFRHYLFVDSLAVYYRPVQNLSYIFDYWLWRDNPFGYHLTNLVLHSCCAFLLFLLLKRILPGLLGSDPHTKQDAPSMADGISFCVALVWAVHPVHNAAVAYISGRADSLIAVFALGAWLLFLKSESAHLPTRWLLRGIAFLSTLLALGSKEAGLLWVVLFLVWVFAFETKYSSGKKAALLMTVLLVLGCYWLLRQLPGPRPSPDIDSADPFPARLLLMFRAMGDYAGLIFWPSQLHMERMLGQVGPYSNLGSWLGNIRYEYLSVIGLLAFGTMLWGAARKSPDRRLRIFGSIWFLLGFIPISNLIPLNAQAAEHWIYMPSIGFMLFLSGVLVEFPAWHSLMASFILMSIVPLGIRTAYRSADWADQEKLFRQTAIAGGGTERIHLNLANLSTAGGELELGERKLRATLQHFPDYVPAQINLGINLLKQKKEAEAEKFLSLDPVSAVRAAKDHSHSWSAPLNFARLRCGQNRQAEAVGILEEAMIIYPGIWELLALKAKILQQIRGPAAAIPEVQAYVENRWWHFGASMLLGDLRGANDETVPAMAAWRNAATLDIHNAQPFIRMARFAVGKNQFQQALEAQMKAIEREPDQSGNFLLLAAILDRMNRPAESEAAILRAEELRRHRQYPN